MKNIILLLGLFVSISTMAQTYIDKPFVQDYSDKFEFSNTNNVKLLQVSGDRKSGCKDHFL